jgi:sugar lactone lactonase YvrE
MVGLRRSTISSAWREPKAGRAARIACVRPDGALDQFVDTPCTWPTSCAFGGPDFATLYVTSARFTMTAEHIGAHPEEGALFAFEVGVRGRPELRFK